MLHFNSDYVELNKNILWIHRNLELNSNFCLIAIEITEEPRIEPFVLPSTIQVKQRQTITCTVIRGDPPLQLRWFKDGQLIDQQLKQRLSLRTHQLEEYSSALVFDRTRPEHRGNYTCSATNQVKNIQNPIFDYISIKLNLRI